MIPPDALFKTTNAGALKNQRLSGQVPHKLAEIDKVSVMKGCADRKTYCRSPVYGLRDSWPNV